jgi:predicted ATPase/class 3 adenylate cyclase
MAGLPSGTVTFLFTDVEASTRLWQDHPEAMRDTLARHDALLRSAIESHGGFVVKTTGDGFHAAFSTAHDAVEAAIEAQRAIGAESWDAVGPLRVRMGVHTGEAQHRDGDYYGTAVNRAARLMAVAHGGQLLVSDATERLLGDAGESFELVDLGEHRLRDLAQASRVFQVVATELGREFPPLRSMEAFPGNLPVQLTSFVGRDDELVLLAKMMGASRLVTLTGVGGVGKTRLALQVAAELLPRFPDGVWFCELATASDDELMFQAVADAVGARQREGMSIADSVVEYLRDREVLVVLDNCEHLLTDAAWLASSMLQRCPEVRILATSREGLGVGGEQLVALPSLSVPAASADADAMTASEAIWLFVDRAAAVRSGFTLGPANLAPVAEICRRLDGMPLAIELAAARVTAMSPAEIATKLDERFRLLTGGKRSRVERHQTLRATVEWSYSLLDAKERSVFERLGVFVGSFDAAAAEAVVTDDDIESWDVLEGLASLVEKSMVVIEETDDGTTRYRLLETLRAFAREQLDAADRTDDWRRRHAAYYAEFCERAGPQLVGPDELTWVRRIEADLDNLRAVLRWGLDAASQGDADLALRVVIALSARWNPVASFLWTWADALTARARSSSVVAKDGVIATAADYHMVDDDPDAAERLAREALEGLAGTDTSRFVTLCYWVLASVRYRQGQAAQALELLAEGHRALEAVDAPPSDHGLLHSLAPVFHLAVGDADAARREADMVVEIAGALGSPQRLGAARGMEGRAWFSEDPDRALAAFEESIALSQVGAAVGENVLALGGAAQLRARKGDRFGALKQLRDAVALTYDAGVRVSLGFTVERAVAILASLGDDELAAFCAGIVASQSVTAFRTLPQVDRTAARVAERMGADAYEAAFARGAALSFDEVAPALLADLDRLLDAS